MTTPPLPLNCPKCPRALTFITSHQRMGGHPHLSVLRARRVAPRSWWCVFANTPPLKRVAC